MNVSIHATNFDEAEKKYNSMGNVDGDFRMAGKTLKSVDDVTDTIDETLQNMYARDYNMAKRGEFKPTVLRNFTSAITNFDKWIFERIDENMKRVVNKDDDEVAMCVIPKHYIIKNKNSSELTAFIKYFDPDSEFDKKFDKYMAEKYPQFTISRVLKYLTCEDKNAMIMPVMVLAVFSNKKD